MKVVVRLNNMYIGITYMSMSDILCARDEGFEIDLA